MTKLHRIVRWDHEPIEFELPETPLEAARQVAYILDEYTGNSLGYPTIVTPEEWEKEQREAEEGGG